MPSKRQLLLLGCVGWISVFTIGKSTGAVNSTGTSLTCKHTVSLIFVSDNWTTQMIGGRPVRVNLQDHFFLVRLNMEKITKESGIECAFDKAGVVLQCCDMGHVANFEQAEGTELTELPDSSGEYEISTLNIVGFYSNVLLLFLVMIWELIMSIQYPENLVPAGLRERVDRI